MLDESLLVMRLDISDGYSSKTLVEHGILVHEQPNCSVDIFFELVWNG